MDTTFQSPKTNDTGGLEMKIDKSKKYIKRSNICTRKVGCYSSPVKSESLNRELSTR